MSLVKLYRKDWADKKSTKRLKTVLKKCRVNYIELYKIMYVLKSYNISTKDVETLYNSWVLKAAQLDNIITRRNE